MSAYAKDEGVSGRQVFPTGWLGGITRTILVIALSVHPMAYAGAMAAEGRAAVRSGSVSIRTPDFDESLRWYRDNLGFRLLSTRSLDQGRVALMEREGFLLEIAEADHPAPALAGAPSEVAVTTVPVIDLLVPDVDEEIDRLRSTGVEILEMPQDDLDGAYRIAQIRDNGHHRIELREPLGDRGSFHSVGR